MSLVFVPVEVSNTIITSGAGLDRRLSGAARDLPRTPGAVAGRSAVPGWCAFGVEHFFPGSFGSVTVVR
jgi:hypothetical protein